MSSIFGWERAHELVYSSWSCRYVYRLCSFLIILVLELNKFDFHPWTLLWKNGSLLFIIPRVFLHIPHPPCAFLTLDYLPLQRDVMMISPLSLVFHSCILFYRNYTKQRVKHICLVSLFEVKWWLTHNALSVLVFLRVAHRLPIDRRWSLWYHTLLLRYRNLLKRCGSIYVELVFWLHLSFEHINADS